MTTLPSLKHHLWSIFSFYNRKPLAKRMVKVNDPEVLQNANSILGLNFLQRCDSTAKSTRENILDAFAVDHICSCHRCRLRCCLWQVRGRPPANWKYHPATMLWRKLSEQNWLTGGGKYHGGIGSYCGLGLNIPKENIFYDHEYWLDWIDWWLKHSVLEIS